MTRSGKYKFEEVPTRGYYPRISAEVRQVVQYDKKLVQTPHMATQNHEHSVTVTARTLPPGFEEVPTPSMVPPPRTPQ